jgi:predicted component of type VI protein secretion system
MRIATRLVRKLLTTVAAMAMAAAMAMVAAKVPVAVAMQSMRAHTKPLDLVSLT